MSNSLTANNPELWRSLMQKNFFKESVSLGVASADLRAELTVGDQLHQPYAGYPRVQTYTKGTDISVKDINTTDDSVTVNTTKVASFYVDQVDMTQSKYEILNDFAVMGQRQLTNDIDQAVMGQYTNANTTLDAGDIGGSSGSGIVLSTANAADIFTAQGRVLNQFNRMSRDRFTIIGPRMLEKLQLYVGGRETGFGEQVSDNGLVSNRFGFELYLSNNLPFSATWTPANNPSDGDTVSVNGVTFTFRTSPSSANDVDVGGTTAVSLDNLVAAINDTGTAGTDYIQLSDDDRQLIEEAGITATDGTTDMDISGYGDIVVASSDSNDPWSAQTQYALAGIKKSIALITQIAPNVEIREAQVRLGQYIHPWNLYGVGTFERMKKNLVATQFDVSDWS